MRLIVPSLMAAYFLFMFPTQAQAYIDPGTGSLLLQSLAAAGVCVMVFWGSLRRKIFGLFRRKKDEPSQDGQK